MTVSDRCVSTTKQSVPEASEAAAVPALSLLDAVARFTHHRDIDSLNHSFTVSLAQLFQAGHVELYKRASEHGDYSHVLLRCTRAPDGSAELFSSELDRHDPLHEAVRLCRSTTLRQLADGSHQLLMPIHCDGVLIGSLRLHRPQPLETARMLIEGLVEIYANYIGLLNESERDKLTGLYNRRTFDRHLRMLLQQVRRQHAPEVDTAAANGEAHDGRDAGERQRLHVEKRLKLPGSLWLAIVDIDFFKRINDTYGHLYGDEVILLLAQQMRLSFREGEVLFRFGGEEFVVLLTASDRGTAHAALERFRKHIAQYIFPQIGSISVSVGFAVVGHNDYPTTVMDRADKALYYAKQTGRNQVFSYEDLRSQGELGSTPAGSVDLF